MRPMAVGHGLRPTIACAPGGDDLGDGCVQLLVGDDPVDHADRQRFLGADRLTGEYQPFRQAPSHAPRRALRAAETWIDADAGLRKRQRRLRRGDDRVARERELDAAAERQAVQARDDRLGAGLERAQERLTALGERRDRVDRAGFDVAHEEPDVGSRHERLAAPRNDDPFHRGIARRGMERFLQLRHNVLVERIHRVWTIDGHRGDIVFDL